MSDEWRAVSQAEWMDFVKSRPDLRHDFNTAGEPVSDNYIDAANVSQARHWWESYGPEEWLIRVGAEPGPKRAPAMKLAELMQPGADPRVSYPRRADAEPITKLPDGLKPMHMWLASRTSIMIFATRDFGDPVLAEWDGKEWRLGEVGFKT